MFCEIENRLCIHFNFSNSNLNSRVWILKFVIKFVAVTSGGRERLMKLAGPSFQIWLCTLSFFTASFNLHRTTTNQRTPYKNDHRSRALVYRAFSSHSLFCTAIPHKMLNSTRTHEVWWWWGMDEWLSASLFVNLTFLYFGIMGNVVFSAQCVFH